MREGLTRILHRLAAIGLLLAVAALIFAAGVLPLARHYTELRADIKGERELLGRFEAFTATKDAVEAMARQSNGVRQSGIFLPGETDALRAANLQALVRRIAEVEGVRLTSARSLPTEEKDGLRLIGMQAELDAGIAQLQSIILALETHRPYLFVHSLQIAPAGGYRAKGDTLKVRFAISGAAAPEGDTQL